MIDVKGLKKRFCDTSAVRDVSFLARNGSVTGLLGANGAGKSTTPDDGSIRIAAGTNT